MAAIEPAHGTATPADNLRHWVEAQIRAIMHRYGYQEIRLPALEGAALADDRHDAMDRLRPDGMPSCVRAVLASHSPARRGIERLWFLGPVLWDSPQGPRQTVQFGVVVFNAPGAAIEAELVLLISELWQSLGVAPSFELRVANLGSWQEQHRSAATRFSLQTRRHFAEFTHLLDALALPWQPDPHSATGRGYFNHSIFDWRWRPSPDEPGLCNGGRCDDLASRLLSRPISAAGLAIDIERLMACLGHYHRPATQSPPRVTLRAEQREQATDLVLLGRTLRARLPGYHIRTLLSGMALDEVPDPADWRLILRQDGLLTVRSRSQGTLGELALDALIALLNSPGANERKE